MTRLFQPGSPLEDPNGLRYATDERQLRPPESEEVQRALDRAFRRIAQNEPHPNLLRDEARFDSNKAGRIQRKEPNKAAWLRLLALELCPSCTDALIDLQRLVPDQPPGQRLVRARTLFRLAEQEWEEAPVFVSDFGGLHPSGRLSPYIRAHGNLRRVLEAQRPEDPEAEQLLLQQTRLISEYAPDVFQHGVFARFAALWMSRGELDAARRLLPECTPLHHAWLHLLDLVIHQDEHAQAQFDAALELNRFVLPLLLLNDSAPRPRFGPPASRAEAAGHAPALNQAWQAYPQALDWLRAQRISPHLLKQHHKHQARRSGAAGNTLETR